MDVTVAVIGAGIIAEEHLQAVEAVEGLHALAVADINAQKAEMLAERYNTRSYTDYQDMIKTETPNMVIITLPHYLHKEASVFSAEQGCHILLEKPMALTAAECEKIIQSARKNRVQLMVGHIQQYFHENRTAKQIVEQGELGSLVMINETRHLPYFTRERPRWFFECSKAGGGIVMNLGAHCIDKIQWLLDTKVSQVMAAMTYKGEEAGVAADVEGSGLLFLHTERGIPASISLAGYEVVPKQRTELIFTNGMMKVEIGKGVWVIRSGVYEKVASTKETPPFVRQLTEFLRAVKGEGTVKKSGPYAKSIIEVLEAGYQSHKQGKMVSVPPERRADQP
ncbi:Gfo/Idh/MocA family protein [Salibacterium aidingense]|uniref:Gfo/Idh/MocA family protein n=1 Tax=Salibacterium aidingense TaxID=384933 RepID=UPI00040A06E0|nr:Gfo/Idh/MocA family oxidoreductase [Salibacterium aidingense]